MEEQGSLQLDLAASAIFLLSLISQFPELSGLFFMVPR